MQTKGQKRSFEAQLLKEVKVITDRILGNHFLNVCYFFSKEKQENFETALNLASDAFFPMGMEIVAYSKVPFYVSFTFKNILIRAELRNKGLSHYFKWSIIENKENTT